jgi:histidinol dehydrogenase
MNALLAPDQFPIIDSGRIPLRRSPSLDSQTLAEAARIMDDVERDGERAIHRYAAQFGEVAPGAPLSLTAAQLQEALGRIPGDQRQTLQRAADRIAAFAAAQRSCMTDLRTEVPGGEAGHECIPVQSAGCYAPGGRYPLPSSVLMTAITARAAGVPSVWVASPKPTDITLAAAAIAGADGLLTFGGAHAIAALAFGLAGAPPCDIIVGPGNRWVTAAKQLVSGRIGIDMPAGPSELLIIADERADPNLIAADLLAQAEHDPDAVPMLITSSRALARTVREQLADQLHSLPTRDTAAQSLRNGFALIAETAGAAAELANQIAPEHLQLMLDDAADFAPRIRHCGGLFIGSPSAEVLGDYGAGPNHVLPTAGAARFTGGLSVFTFLRVRTWLRVDDLSAARPLLEDAGSLADLEGLAGHARSARARLSGGVRKAEPGPPAALTGVKSSAPPAESCR